MSGYCPGCGRITHVCPPVETRNTPVTITPTFPDVALRDALVRAINGWPISPELAWAILHRWDANSQLSITVVPVETLCGPATKHETMFPTPETS